MRQSSPRPHRPPTTIPTQRSLHDAELIDEMSDFLDEVDAMLDGDIGEEKGGR